MKPAVLILLLVAFAVADESPREQNQKASGITGKGFETKSFSFGEGGSAPGFNKSFSTGGSHLTKSSHFGEKSFLLPNQTAGLNPYPVGTFSLGDKQPFSKLSSDYGDKSFSMSDRKVDGMDRGYEVKPYLGKENSRIQSDLKTIRETLGGIKDLPERPLTIEEVKALVNKDSRPASADSKK